MIFIYSGCDVATTKAMMWSLHCCAQFGRLRFGSCCVCDVILKFILVHVVSYIGLPSPADGLIWPCICTRLWPYFHSRTFILNLADWDPLMMMITDVANPYETAVSLGIRLILPTLSCSRRWLPVEEHFVSSASSVFTFAVPPSTLPNKALCHLNHCP